MELLAIIAAIIAFLLFNSINIRKINKNNRNLLLSINNNVTKLKSNFKSVSKSSTDKRLLEVFEKDLSNYITLIESKYIVEHRMVLHPESMQIYQIYLQREFTNSPEFSIKNYYIDSYSSNKPKHISWLPLSLIEKEKEILTDIIHSQ